MSSPDPLPPPPWGDAAKARRSRTKPPLTREAIVDAALVLLDRDGLRAVTMRRVAGALTTGPASLYQHIDGKEELLQLLYDRIAADIEVPPTPAPGDDWAEPLKVLMRSLRAVLSSHRDIAHGAVARGFFGPNALAVSEGMLAIMDAGGVPPEISTHAIDALYLLAIVTAYAENLRPTLVDGDESEYAERIRAYFAALPTDRFPTLVRLANPLTRPDTDADEHFELALEVHVRGIAALADEARRAASGG